MIKALSAFTTTLAIISVTVMLAAISYRLRDVVEAIRCAQ